MCFELMEYFVMYIIATAARLWFGPFRYMLKQPVRFIVLIISILIRNYFPNILRVHRFIFFQNYMKFPLAL